MTATLVTCTADVAAEPWTGAGDPEGGVHPRGARGKAVAAEGVRPPTVQEDALTEAVIFQFATLSFNIGERVKITQSAQCRPLGL